MKNENELYEEVIKVLAEAPTTAIKKLIAKANSEQEKEEIKKIAKSMGVNIED